MAPCPQSRARLGGDQESPDGVREARRTEAHGRDQAGQPVRGPSWRAGSQPRHVGWKVVGGGVPPLSHTSARRTRQLGGQAQGWDVGAWGQQVRLVPFCSTGRHHLLSPTQGHRPCWPVAQPCWLGLAGADGPSLWSLLFKEWRRALACIRRHGVFALGRPSACSLAGVLSLPTALRSCWFFCWKCRWA